MSRSYRFTITKEDVLNKAENSISIKSKDLLHQINNVLRLKKDHSEEITMIDGGGEVFYAEILSINKSQIELKILKIESSQRELNTKVTFFLPVIKAENFTWMLRKLTELGVQNFIPVIFERSQKANVQALSSTKSYERLGKIMQEATEQCEGAIFPKIHEAINFNDIKNHLQVDTVKVFANERLADSVQGSKLNTELKLAELCLLVGPEGGLTDQEVTILESWDFKPYGLGRRLLKAETAAISLVSKLVIT